MKIIKFTFNPLQENTYLICDPSGECVIIDAGCQSEREKQTLKNYIDNNNFKPVALLNTHCHFDHVLGNKFVCEQYKVKSWIHEGDMANLNRFEAGASLFGMAGDTPPTPEGFFTDGEIFKFGNSELQIIHTPGHSPGGICFYSEKYKFLISGDTLFAGSIGRTDLPGGDYDQIMVSLQKLMQLPGGTTVYCGHGPETGISYENMHNPFINKQ